MNHEFHVIGGDYIYKIDQCRCTDEYRKLYEMYNKAESILNDIGFKNITVNRISFNNRLTSTLGWYISSTKSIEISSRHFACGTYEEVLNTIIHEISHNICEEKYGEQIENGGHTKEWYEIADYITEKTGYEIKPTSNVTEDKNKIISIPKYFHRFKCKKCGYEYTAYSKFRDSSKVRKQKCIGCLSNHKVLGYEFSEGEFECIKNGLDHYEHKYKMI